MFYATLTRIQEWARDILRTISLRGDHVVLTSSSLQSSPAWPISVDSPSVS